MIMTLHDVGFTSSEVEIYMRLLLEGDHTKAQRMQILICTAGEGWYQEEGKAPVSLTAGMVIPIPPEVKHWHGAKKDSWFSHIAAEIPSEGTSNEWCEPVSDKEYNELEEN